MTSIKEQVMAIRQEVRSLECEQKELTKDLYNLKHKETPNYATQHTLVTDRLQVVGETIEKKRGELYSLIEKQQLSLF